MVPVLVFDIETVPDAEGIRKVLAFGPELNDAGVVEFAMERRRQASGIEPAAAFPEGRRDFVRPAG